MKVFVYVRHIALKNEFDALSYEEILKKYNVHCEREWVNKGFTYQCLFFGHKKYVINALKEGYGMGVDWKPSDLLCSEDLKKLGLDK